MITMSTKSELFTSELKKTYTILQMVEVMKEYITYSLDNIKDISNFETELKNLKTVVATNYEVLNSKFNADYETLQTKINNLSTNTQTLVNTNVDNLQAQINTINNDIATIETSIETLTSKVNNNTDSIETLTSKVSNNTDSIESLTSKVNNNITKIDSLEGLNTYFITNIETLKTEVDNNKSNIETLNKDFNTRVDYNSESIVVINKNLEIIGTNITELKNDTSFNLSKATTNEENISALTTRVDTLETKKIYKHNISFSLIANKTTSSVKNVYYINGGFNIINNSNESIETKDTFINTLIKNFGGNIEWIDTFKDNYSSIDNKTLALIIRSTNTPVIVFELQQSLSDSSITEKNTQMCYLICDGVNFCVYKNNKTNIEILCSNITINNYSINEYTIIDSITEL